MVIVAGHLVVDPDQTESYLADSRNVVEQARSAAGCMDLSITADLLDSGCINIFELWTSREAVDAFRGSGPDDEQQAAIRSASVTEYEVAGTRTLA